MKSAASSGDALIKCPHFRCSNILGIREIAHILFDGFHSSSRTEEMLHPTKILMKLVQFRVEQYLSTMGNECDKGTTFVFCPTPSCKRIFSFKKKTNMDEEHSQAMHGSNMILCSCGASICADCRMNGNNMYSHLGLTCKQYKYVRKEIDSGRMDAEFQR